MDLRLSGGRGGRAPASAGRRAASPASSAVGAALPATRAVPAAPPPPQIDYVRVWQDPVQRNVGCSPAGFPTAQYLACNRDTFVVTDADQALIPQACAALPACKAQAGYERQGVDGKLYQGRDQPLEVPNVATPQECCQVRRWSVAAANAGVAGRAGAKHERPAAGRREPAEPPSVECEHPPACLPARLPAHALAAVRRQPRVRRLQLEPLLLKHLRPAGEPARLEPAAAAAPAQPGRRLPACPCARGVRGCKQRAASPSPCARRSPAAGS